MTTRTRVSGQLFIGVACAAALSGSTCLQLLTPCTEDAMVTVRLINDSATQSVSPNLGFCPNGMANVPHHFVSSPPVLGPGEEATYTSCEVAGSFGNCRSFGADFAIGLCGWRYGADQAQLTQASRRFGGQITHQFNCGDTVILRWTDAGDSGGAWASEVQAGAGNTQPGAAFQEL
jgi:hypothetical protein